MNDLKALFAKYAPNIKVKTRKMLLTEASNPVVNEYLKDLNKYWSTHHDDMDDMNNYLTALGLHKTAVEKEKTRFQKQMDSTEARLKRLTKGAKGVKK